MPNRWKMLQQTILITVGVIIIKYLLQHYGWEFLSITSLHTGLLAGSLFVLGFILSSTHADYKESEKIPVDLTTLLESMHQDGTLWKERSKNFDLTGYTKAITAIGESFISDIHEGKYQSILLVKRLALFIEQMEQQGMPPNYIVKLKQEQSSIMRIIQRMHYLQKIQPLPSAFILAESIVVLMLGLLLATKIGNLADEITISSFLAFMYIYLLQLIKVLDKPFHPQGSTSDDVSLFLLKEQIQRLKQ